MLSLPDGSALSANDKVGIFGNLGHVWCGTEPGFRVDILDQATINDGSSDVSLGETAQASVRVIEFFDAVVVDPEGFLNRENGGLRSLTHSPRFTGDCVSLPPQPLCRSTKLAKHGFIPHLVGGRIPVK